MILTIRIETGREEEHMENMVSHYKYSKNQKAVEFS